MRKRTKGSSLTNYGMLASFISIAAVSSLYVLGPEVRDLFEQNSTAIADASIGNLPSSVDDSDPVDEEETETEPETPINPDHPDYTGGPVAPGEADPRCYESGNVGTVPDNSFYGCGQMLIVDEDMMRAKGSSQHGGAQGYAVGDGTYQFEIDGKIYAFGDPASGVFTGQLKNIALLFAGNVGNRNTWNGDISYWDTSNVTKMRGTFLYNNGFNADISGWDVSNVTVMDATFSNNGAFNQDISGWDVSNVTIGEAKGIPMYGVFNNNTAFNQDLSSWCVSHIASKPSLFDSNASSWTGGTATRPQWGQPCD